MAPISVRETLSSLRARAVDGAATVYAKLLMRLSRGTLEALERHGVPGAGWALLALAIEPGSRE